jgi:hypothetical protein
MLTIDIESTFKWHSTRNNDTIPYRIHCLYVLYLEMQTNGAVVVVVVVDDVGVDMVGVSGRGH